MKVDLKMMRRMIDGVLLCNCDMDSDADKKVVSWIMENTSIGDHLLTTSGIHRFLLAKGVFTAVSKSCIVVVNQNFVKDV